MDRRAFLYGTIASAGTALMFTPARSDPARVQFADLRGTLTSAEVGLDAASADDQSQAFQAAVDRAARAGRPLLLPPGRYEISNIRLPDRLRLVGIPGETRLVYGGGGALLVATGLSELSLEGLVFDGANRALAEDTPALLHLVDVKSLAMTRVDILGSARHAIALERVGGRIDTCHMSGAREAGLWSVDGTGLDIADCAVTGCGNAGIRIHRFASGEDGTVLTRNRIDRIAARTDSGGNGIDIFRADGVVLGGNRIADCAAAAIRLNAARNPQVDGNQLLRSGTTAIAAEYAVEGAMISGNMIDGAVNGIVVNDSRDGGRLAVIASNMLRNLRRRPGAAASDMGGVGIYVEADASVTGNVVEGADTTGLQLGWGTNLRNVVASGNMIRSAATGIGVSVADGVGATVITGNMLADVPSGAIRGMRGADFVTGDLVEAGDGAYPGLTLDRNRLG